MDADVHACLDAKRWGGRPEDYIHIHQWLDETKTFYADYRHRALRHHTEGVGMALKLFGSAIRVGKARKRVSVRLICENHITEDLGYLPSVQDWLSQIRGRPWMWRGVAARQQVAAHNKQAWLSRAKKRVYAKN